jgi:hypothetical protein
VNKVLILRRKSTLHGTLNDIYTKTFLVRTPYLGICKRA